MSIKNGVLGWPLLCYKTFTLFFLFWMRCILFMNDINEKDDGFCSRIGNCWCNINQELQWLSWWIILHGLRCVVRNEMKYFQLLSSCALLKGLINDSWEYEVADNVTIHVTFWLNITRLHPIIDEFLIFPIQKSLQLIQPAT